jgi:hypothetical protein
MKVPKPTRVKSPSNLRLIRDLPCAICMQKPTEAHHWKSKGAGGDDSLENLLPLCPPHHREFHNSGEETFWKEHWRQIEWFRKMKDLPPLKNKSKVSRSS